MNMELAMIRHFIIIPIFEAVLQKPYSHKSNMEAIIQSRIHEIRGQRVMLDFDLAEMYGIETKRLKEAVKRNLKRFEGEDFMFELTKEELSRSQIATLNKSRGKNFKYMPFAFTELGLQC